MLSDQLACAHTFWLRTELTVQKKHPVSCRRLVRLVSTVWCTATHQEVCGSAALQSSITGHSHADFAECPRSRASTRCVIGQISQRGIRGSSLQNPRRNQQEPRQQFLHHKENISKSLTSVLKYTHNTHQQGPSNISAAPTRNREACQRFLQMPFHSKQGPTSSVVAPLDALDDVIQSSMLVSVCCPCSWLVRPSGCYAGTQTLDEKEDTAVSSIGDLMLDGSVEKG